METTTTKLPNKQKNCSIRFVECSFLIRIFKWWGDTHAWSPPSFDTIVLNFLRRNLCIRICVSLLLLSFSFTEHTEQMIWPLCVNLRFCWIVCSWTHLLHSFHGDWVKYQVVMIWLCTSWNFHMFRNLKGDFYPTGEVLCNFKRWMITTMNHTITAHLPLSIKTVFNKRKLHHLQTHTSISISIFHCHGNDTALIYNSMEKWLELDETYMYTWTMEPLERY